MSVPDVRLDGRTLLAAGDVAWPRRAGISPVIESFAVTPGDAEAMLGMAKDGVAVTLKIDGRQIRNLRVLREIPARDPYLRRIVVADRRIDWPRKWVVRRYNKPRRVGVRRRGADWQQELRPALVPIIQHAWFSTRDGIPWTPAEVMVDLLEYLGEKVKMDAEVAGLAIPIQDLELHDNGASAVRRALGYIPGAEIDMLDDGSVRVFSTISGKEKGIVGDGRHDPTKPGKAGYEAVGGGHVAYVLENYERPSEVHCLFAIESELRFDFTGDRADTTIALDAPPLRMRNVVRIPDPALTLSDGSEVNEGSYVELGSYLDSINSASAIKVTDLLLRQAMVPDGGLWEYLNLAGEADLVDPIRKNWMARFAALRRDYRQLFQIERHWMDRILSIRDYLVGTIDLTSGQRAPTLVFADYSFRHTRKNRYINAALAGAGAVHYGTNVSAYVAGDPGATDQPAPARVRIEDAEQGIIRLEWVLDPYNMRDWIFPSHFAMAAQRNMRPHNRNAPVMWNGVAADGTLPALKDEVQIAMYLTAVPAAPNDTRQLYRVVIKPTDVAGMLPAAAREGLGSAKGPPIEIFIPHETARIRWTQAAEPLIRRLFGAGGRADPPAADELTDLVINDAPQEDLGATMASLRNLALATSAGIYARYHARVHGSMTGPMRTDIPLEGALSEIRHHVRQDGARLSTYMLRDQMPELDMFGFLDSGTRQIVLRQIQGPLGAGGG